MEKEDEVIQTSSFILNKLNNSNCIYSDDLVFERLSGISNQTFKISINSQSDNISKKSIIYKKFGKINCLVDRDLEMKLLNEMASKNIGPKIYQTDLKTYRVEEYLENTRNIFHYEMFQEKYLNRIIERFLCINQIGDINYISYVGIKEKNDCYNLLVKEKQANVFNFSLGMKNLAKISIDNFEKELQLNKKDYSSDDYINYCKNISSIKEKINTSIEDIINISPKYWIFTLNHNDAHPCNILVDSKDSIFLIDLEYCGYNFLGFDIGEFLLDSIFNLDHKDFPHWIQLEDFSTYDKELYYEIWKNYISKYFEIYQASINEILIKEKLEFTIEDIRKEYLSIKTYKNMISIASIYWFLYGVLYLKYDEFVKKSSFDYYSFSIKRYSIKEYIVDKIVI